MRILTASTLIVTALLLIIMIAICAVNIFIHVRHRPGFFTQWLHIWSGLALAGGFCLLMDTVILDLPLEKGFRTAGVILLILCTITVITSAIVFLLKAPGKALRFGSSTDLQAIFTAVDDLILVVDYKGNIVDVNHPERLRGMCNDAEVFSEAIIELERKTQDPFRPFPGDINEIADAWQSEFHLPLENTYYLLSISPIILGANRVGFTVVFQDITAIKQSEIELKEQNIHLEAANSKLARYIKMAGVLEAEKERLRILEQLQAALIKKIEDAVVRVDELQREYLTPPAYNAEIRNAANSLRSI